MTASTRPTVFIGSSTEGLEIASAIQLNLDHTCDATVWSQGVFGLGSGTLETLVARKDDFDFAILVLTPDDLTTKRKETTPSPRDNVLLELGIFLGAIGRERTFAVYDRNAKLALPTDLAGVTHATYQLHADKNLPASLGAATTLIRASIVERGKRAPIITAEIDTQTQFQIIHDLLENGAEQFIIWMFENDAPLIREPYIGTGLQHEYWMRNHAGGRGMFSVDSFCQKLPDAGLLQQDLRQNVNLTERGRDFAGWLVENGHKAVFFESDVGGWGERPSSIDGWPPPDFLNPSTDSEDDNPEDEGRESAS